MSISRDRNIRWCLICIVQRLNFLGFILYPLSFFLDSPLNIRISESKKLIIHLLWTNCAATWQKLNIIKNVQLNFVSLHWVQTPEKSQQYFEKKLEKGLTLITFKKVFKIFKHKLCHVVVIYLFIFKKKNLLSGFDIVDVILSQKTVAKQPRIIIY